ncbi:Glycerol-3-phosphate regulon repressor, DeoR family [Salmonella enterica subsp. enterica]|uniref:Glycerol-3-phosphate regulon repressor, DeoR family n=1 Tax=Salmonella enterica I TaxID=59201 RepID=A0A379WJM9_SALET|nr:Glycerol-3-phosphate regulon repressor, DeoR family [Salmonella enterica subsp. enterica]
MVDAVYTDTLPPPGVMQVLTENHINWSCVNSVKRPTSAQNAPGTYAAGQRHSPWLSPDGKR